MSKERPILFSGEMVKAILEGRKTQTRRVVKNLLPFHADGGPGWQPKGKRQLHYASEKHFKKGFAKDFCPYGEPRDRLWVKETWAVGPIGGTTTHYYIYRADFEEMPIIKWKPSLFMPKSAARLWLDILKVRIERLQDISEEDAKAEGAVKMGNPLINIPMTYRSGFESLWESINGRDKKKCWAANPWVWVVEFMRIESLGPNK